MLGIKDWSVVGVVAAGGIAREAFGERLILCLAVCNAVKSDKHEARTVLNEDEQ